MKSHTVKPLLLVADRPVTMREQTGDETPHAFVFERRGTYEIVTNPPACYDMYKKSWLYKKILFEEFMCGIILHEVSHIRYGTFTIRPQIKTELFHYILNVLLDNQIEYSLTNEFPSLAQYIRWILVGLRRDADLSGLKKKKDFGLIESTLHSLYYLTRFGVIVKNADPEFINFCLPLMLSATRGDARNCHDVATAIYEWLFAKVADAETRELMKQIAVTTRAVGLNDFDALDDAQQVAGSNSLNIVSDGMQGKGPLPGSGNEQFILKEQETGFYRQTVMKYPEIIAMIRQALQRRLDMLRKVSMYDGDLSFGRQQQAYINSLIGEAGRDFTVLMRQDPSVDVVIIRDVSGSTDSVKVAYAEALVCLLAGASGIYGIRLAEIDFSDTAMALLDFDQELRTARIQPDSRGGTNLVPALQVAEQMKWKGKRRVMIIITDNGLSDFFDAGAKIKRLDAEMRIKTQKIDISGATLKGDVISCTVEQLPYTLSEILLKLL